MIARSCMNARRFARRWGGGEVAGSRVAAKRRSQRRGSRPAAFSLTELLVVIGVLVVLLSILIPALSRAREAAARTVCASNLRQLFAAYTMYANANRNLPPGPGNVSVVLDDDWVYWQASRDLDRSALATHLSARGGQLESLLRCPLAPPPERRPFTPLCKITYSMNTGLWRGYWQGQPRLKVSQVRSPADKALLYDEDQNVGDGAF